MDDGLRMPPGFRFGVATAAYQIEGGVTAGGRGRSVWDTFTARPDRIADGSTGAVSCDSYHRWAEDVALLRDLGAAAYRFSIAWPRIQPTGRGAPNPTGLAYYDRLVDALLEAGVAPCPTLFHWDLPQDLEDVGGWLNRDTAARFAEYAGHVATALADRVDRWITLNEPVVVTTYGYATGVHAPGRTLGLGAFPTAHHQLLGHGLAARALRAVRAEVPVGITHNLAPVHPATTDPVDVAAARGYDALRNRMYTDPVLRGRYPDELTGATSPIAAHLGVVRPDDLAVIAAPLDFLGVNYYNPDVVRAAGPGNPVGVDPVPWPGPEPLTAFGWPVVPDGLRELLVGLAGIYGADLPPIHITENGAAYDDAPAADGTVPDPERIAFLDGHLRAVRAAIDAGVDVRGYFCWSLLDNFEWAEGFTKRFGLVHVDYATLRRTPKRSFDWYRRVIAAQA